MKPIKPKRRENHKNRLILNTEQINDEVWCESQQAKEKSKKRQIKPEEDLQEDYRPLEEN